MFERLSHDPELIDFPGRNAVYAQNQSQYRPLPAHRSSDDYGTVSFCWKLSWRDRLHVLFKGTLWHQVLTFHHPLQPQLLLASKPELT